MARIAHLLALVALGAAVTLSPAGCESRSESGQLARKAMMLWDNGHYADAARNFVTLTEIYPDASQVESSLFWAGNLYQYFLDRPDQATRYYQQLIVRFPKGRYFYDAKTNLAELYEKSPDTQHRALQIYQQLVLVDSLKPRHAYFQFKLGSLYLKLGRMDQARMAFREIVRNFPESEYLPETYYLVAYSYYLEERYDVALAVFRKTAKAFPGTPIANRALFFVADTLEEQGDMRQALKVYTALKGRYHSPDILERRIKTLEARIRRGVR